MTFTEEDLKQIEAKGLTVAQVFSQIELFNRENVIKRFARKQY